MSEIIVYKPKEVAEILKVSERTIVNYLKSKELPGTKIGGLWRIRKQDLELFLEESVKNTYADSLATGLTDEELEAEERKYQQAKRENNVPRIMAFEKNRKARESGKNIGAKNDWAEEE